MNPRTHTSCAFKVSEGNRRNTTHDYVRLLMSQMSLFFASLVMVLLCFNQLGDSGEAVAIRPQLIDQ